MLSVSVVVPVRNEAHHLVQTLDALRNQRHPDGQPLNPATYEVLLLANNCTDQSYAVALRYQQRYPAFSLHVAQIQLPPHKANIGTVRRLLMDEAFRRLTCINGGCGIIASTDGDTVVDQCWVHYIMLEISRGNDAVGGRILTQPDGSQMRLYHLRDVLYRTLIAQTEALLDPRPHDPWPRHFQHFGASIAVTCQMYRQAGGLPQKPYLEDEAFYKALLRTDAKVRQSPHVKVITSTRTEGRVAIGFSEQLRYWSNMVRLNKDQVTEPAEAVITRLRNRQRLRTCWNARDQADQTDALLPIATDLLLDPEWLHRMIYKSAFFGQLWEQIEKKMITGDWAKTWRPVPITTAIQELRTFLRT
ncbi:glycosyltransferase family 2 protein [Spirosoma arcticum]